MECPVWDLSDAFTDGLVGVKEPLRSTLEALVPGGHFAAEKVCWYQLPTGHIEAYPWRGAFDVGFEFEKKSDGWVFVKKNEYIYLSRSKRRAVG